MLNISILLDSNHLELDAALMEILHRLQMCEAFAMHAVTTTPFLGDQFKLHYSVLQTAVERYELAQQARGSILTGTASGYDDGQ